MRTNKLFKRLISLFLWTIVDLIFIIIQHILVSQSILHFNNVDNNMLPFFVVFISEGVYPYYQKGIVLRK